MHHPWRILRGLGHVTLVWHEGGPKGLTRFAANEISLRKGLNQAERRSTLSHELRHLDRGPVTQMHREREEVTVERQAAGQLIPFDRLVDALLWSRDEYEIAEQCWVDVGIVRARLAGLSPDECRLLDSIIDSRELDLP